MGEFFARDGVSFERSSTGGEGGYEGGVTIRRNGEVLCEMNDETWAQAVAHVSKTGHCGETKRSALTLHRKGREAVEAHERKAKKAKE